MIFPIEKRINTELIDKTEALKGCHGPVVMESGWESERPGFVPQRLKTTFDPRSLKKITRDSQPKQCAFDT